MDKTNPRHRICTIFEDAGVEFYISNEEIDGAEACKFCHMKEILAFDPKIDDVRGFRRNQPEDLAYVIFTSGTEEISQLSFINLSPSFSMKT